MLLDLFSRFDLGTNVIYKAYPLRRLMRMSVIFMWVVGYWLAPRPFNLVLNWVLVRLCVALVGPSFNLAG